MKRCKLTNISLLWLEKSWCKELDKLMLSCVYMGKVCLLFDHFHVIKSVQMLELSVHTKICPAWHLFFPHLWITITTRHTREWVRVFCCERCVLCFSVLVLPTCIALYQLSNPPWSLLRPPARSRLWSLLRRRDYWCLGEQWQGRRYGCMRPVYILPAFILHSAIKDLLLNLSCYAYLFIDLLMMKGLGGLGT